VEGLQNGVAVIETREDGVHLGGSTSSRRCYLHYIV